MRVNWEGGRRATYWNFYRTSHSINLKKEEWWPVSGDVGCCVVNKKLGKLFAIASAASTKRQQTPRCSRPSAFKLLFLFHFSEAFRVLKRKLKKKFSAFSFPANVLVRKSWPTSLCPRSVFYRFHCSFKCLFYKDLSTVFSIFLISDNYRAL